MYKLYVAIVFLILFVIFSLGIALPFLFSARDTFLVICGGCYVIVAIPIVWNVGKYIIKLIKKNKIDDEEI